MSDTGTVERAGRRSHGEIENAFANMLVGTEEQPEVMDSQGEQPDPDSFEEEQELEAEFTDDSVTDEEIDDEFDEQRVVCKQPTSIYIDFNDKTITVYYS